MENALFACHQGWTDIFNSLPLLIYISGKYKHTYALFREDAQPLLDPFLRGKSNITPVYSVKDAHPRLVHHYLTEQNGITNLAHEYIGDWDILRNSDDPYKGAWTKKHTSGDFVRNFYEFYDVPYILRATLFDLERDLNAESAFYDTFVAKHGRGDYCLHHNNAGLITAEVEALQARHPTWTHVNLDQSTPIFWDAIRVLEGAREIHVLDSVWAAVLYMLDTRYRLFENVPITVYCKRGYRRMFTEPVHLPNWTIV